MKNSARRYLGTAAVAAVLGVGIGTDAFGRIQDSPIDRVAEEREVLRQRGLVEFEDAMVRTQQMLDEGAYGDALTAVITAKVKLDRSRAYLSEGEYQSMVARADELRTRISEARIEEEQIQREIEQQEAAIAKEDQRIALSQQRARQINERLQRVRQLQMELKYDACLQVIDEILFIDENNAAALVLRDAIQGALSYQQYSKTERARQLSYQNVSIENHEALIAPLGVMVFPEDWPQRSLRRMGAAGFAEAPADRRVAQILSETMIPVDFQNHSLEQVMTFVENVTGLNVYADWNALDFAGVDRNDTVSLHLNNVSVEAALNRVLEQLAQDSSAPPKFAIEDGILMISTSEALAKHTMPVVYDIRDLLFEVPYFDNAPNFDIARSESAAPVSGFGTPDRATVFDDPVEARRRPSRNELVGQIVDVIQETTGNWRDLNSGTGTIQELNGNLIITQTPAMHRQIDGLLSQLREIRAIQVNVEGRFLAVSSNWFEQIGVDLDVYFNTNNTVRQQQLAADPLSHLSDLFDNSDTGRGRLVDPFFFGNVVDAQGNPVASRIPFGNAIGLPDPAGDTNGDGFTDLLYTVGPVGAPIRATQGFAPIGFSQNSFNTSDGGLVGKLADFDTASFAGIAAAASPALAFGVQFLDDVQVDLMIEATQADRRSVILTAPRLTLFNGQRAWVAVARRQTYISNLTPVTGDNSGAFQPQTDVVNDGFVLDVEVVVSADRRYVTMNVIAEQSEILAIETKGPFGGAAGGGAFGGASNSFEGFLEAPETQVSLVYTTVSVPDKGTVLLGGQRKVEEIEVESGVPILSKIPIINRFFTNRATAKTEETLLILIRPEIIIQQELEDQLFPGLSDRLGNGTSYLP
ncbi:MAG: hypothetical protein KDA25_03820 [Phycisphaerales bacterium]|nr:hypothetical protein [Phycisphaerales bacterium]